MDLIYQLRVPDLSNVLDKDFYHQLFNTNQIFSVGSEGKLEAGYARRNCQEILAPDWRNWRNLNWDQCLLFVKAHGWTSNIHRDSILDEECPWAINWIQGGTGTIDFWKKDQLDSGVKTVDSRGAHNITWYTDQLPYRSYNMKPGCYLINASYPHRATGQGVRYAVSIRSTDQFYRSWEDIVESFRDLIEI